MSRHRGAKPPRRCELLGRSACYPQGSFYPLSDGLSIQHRRITKPDFSSLLDLWVSQSNTLCLCTLRLVSIQAEGIFGRLRYSLGGDRPSQTAHLTLSRRRFHGVRLEIQYNKGSIPTATPSILAYPSLFASYLSCTCCIKSQYQPASKAPWGLSV